MTNAKLLAALAAVGVSFVSFEARADVVTDAHGNQGYDTAAECDAAVLNGSAKFYESFTHKPALKRNGEASVQAATLKDLGPQYRMGACDVGVGHKLGRDGVSKALQGKYVPYSPDMPVNVYLDAAGKPVRVTMKQCDNWFSGNAPRPVEVPAPAPAPVAAAPVEAAPVAAAKPAGVRPYAFGTVGALRDGIKSDNGRVDDRDAAVAGQVGVGVQFNEWLGGEVLYQGGDKHKYEAANANSKAETRNHTFGGRLTAGANVTEKARLFAKAGVAGVKHSDEVYGVEGKAKARATAGVGATYDLTDNWAIRGDYDHYFKRSGSNGEWKGSDYLGAGVQYKF